MIYRKEIDGFRALAVLSVIFFHADLPYFNGGYLGVDIFFVISGFLITSILLEEISKNSFTVISFYERRIRRIIPPLFAMMLLIAPISWFLYGLDDMKNFSQSIASTALFSSNILFWRESGYFGQIAELKPLLHTWSLAVEEQYYILFPIFLLLVKNISHKFILSFLIFIGIISLGLAEWALSTNRSHAAFFLLPTRGWEILLGAYGAFFVSRYPIIPLSTYLQSCLSGLGLVMVICSILFFDESILLPGSYLLIPTFGTLLMILFSNNTNFVGRIFANPLLVFIGLISYSLYLWHQPIFAFAKFSNLDELNAFQTIFIIFSTFILAFLSWKLIEKPFRDKKIISTKVVLSFTAIGIFLFTSFGLVGHLNNGYPNRLGDDALKFFHGWSYAVNYDCESYASSPKDPLNPCQSSKNIDIDTFLVGDSHAFLISGALSREFSKVNKGFYFLPASGCDPSHGLNSRPSEDFCSRHNSLLYKFIKQNNEVKNIIIHASWFKWFEQEKLLNKSIDQKEKALIKLVNLFSKDNLNVFLIYPTPTNEIHIPQILWMQYLRGKEYKQQSIEMSFDPEVLKIFDSLSKMENVYPIKPYGNFCSEAKENLRLCQISNERHPLYSDGSHLTSEGANILARQIVQNFSK